MHYTILNSCFNFYYRHLFNSHQSDSRSLLLSSVYPVSVFSFSPPLFLALRADSCRLAKTVALKLYSSVRLHFPILIFPSFICIRFSISRSSPLSRAAVLFSVESDKSNYTFKLRYAVLSPFFRRLFYTSLATVPASFSFPFSPFRRSFRMSPFLSFSLFLLPFTHPFFSWFSSFFGFLSSAVK